MLFVALPQQETETHIIQVRYPKEGFVIRSGLAQFVVSISGTVYLQRLRHLVLPETVILTKQPQLFSEGNGFYIPHIFL